ncbi:cell division suppressor protein YneA [Sporolactobacillus pectinivorans]|uniref:cell division suppressor protein YneA n=1 Tax=Sporolactobacillus pectinivorans TaxID=1591408 RepID=UPI000C258D5A|nr:LysM peptidoglycan-binding domain-containing protein [Sporolactobacillus pectinivorans]
MNAFFQRHQLKGISYVAILLFMTVVLFLTLTSHVTADSNGFRTITVEKGDSLWSIAQEYQHQNPRLSKESFIELVENENGLVRNHIELGQKLIIPINE